MRNKVTELLAGALVFAFMALHGGVVSNCFRLVEYSVDCSHLECVLPDFEGVDLVVDKRGEMGLATGATAELPAPPAASNLFLRVAVSPKE